MQVIQTIPFAQIQGWFFDLDGTLMDTDDQTVEKLAHRLRFLGAQAAQRMARRMVMASETPMNHVITVFDAINLDPFIFALRGVLRPSSHPTFRLIEGVAPLLAYLSSKARIAVVSTRSRQHAAAFLDQHRLANLFSLSVTQESTRRLKPHPEPVRLAAGQLGLAPESCVMVGDTTVDIRSARRAGAWAIGVLCGFGEEAELRRAGAHVILPSTADLLSLVTETLGA